MRKRFSGKNLYRAPLLLGATLMLSACGLWQVPFFIWQRQFPSPPIPINNPAPRPAGNAP